MVSDMGDRIREARERRGMTQAELAEAVGVAESSVTLWENKRNPRNANRRHLHKVAEVLGLTFSELFGERELAPPIAAATLDTKTVNLSVTKAEKALLDLFRTFPKELQLLQLAQFVQCADLRKIEQFPSDQVGSWGTDTVSGECQAA